MFMILIIWQVSVRGNFSRGYQSYSQVAQAASRFSSLSGLPWPRAEAFSAPGLVPLFRGLFISGILV
jgi:hypothetical protein